MLNHATFDVYSLKAVGTLISLLHVHVKYTGIFFLFNQSVGFKENIRYMYAKKGITSAMECADFAAFTFVT